MKEVTLQSVIPFLEQELEKDEKLSKVKDSFIQNLSKGDESYFVVSEENNHQIQGIIIVKEDNLQIMMLYVKDTVRHQGIGTKLLSYVKQYVEDQNFARLSITSFKDTTPFFKQAGFTTVEKENESEVVNLEYLTMQSYLGKTVRVSIDRPYGSYHLHLADVQYPYNYGYVLDCLPKDDGEFQDAYVVGVYEPVELFTGVVIGIVYHKDDLRSRFIVSPIGIQLKHEDIIQTIGLEEQYYDSQIIWK